MRPATVVIANPEDLLDMIVACAPLDMPEAQMRLAYLGMLNRAITHGKTWHADWHAIWPELDGEWTGLVEEMCTLFPGGQITMKPKVPEPPPGVYMHIMEREPDRRQSYTDNRFMVGSQGFSVTILKPPIGPISVADAVNLAAWIVALADPTRELFDTVLDAALQT